MQWSQAGYELTDERARVDLDAVTALLQATYWAADRPATVIARSVQESLCLSLFHEASQVGFARVVTDRATVAYLCDVVIAPAHQGRGLGNWMLTCLLGHPDLEGCRIDLFTKDAQDFYRTFGFGPHRYTNMVRYPSAGAAGKTSSTAS